MNLTKIILSLCLFHAIQMNSLVSPSQIVHYIDNGDVTHMCNRNLIDSLTPSGLYFNNFSVSQATPITQNHCPQIQQTCCTDSEIDTFAKQEIKNQENFEKIESYFNTIIKFLNLIKVEKLAQRMENKAKEDEPSGNNPVIISDVKGFFDELKGMIPMAKKGLVEFKKRYFSYFHGVMCSVCDATQHLFYRTVKDNAEDVDEEDQKNILKIQISKQGCTRSFQRILSYKTLSDFIFKYITLVRYYEFEEFGEFSITGNLDEQLYKENLKDTEECLDEEKEGSSHEDKCYEICVALHNPSIWKDFYMLDALDRAYYIMNGLYGAKDSSEAHESFVEKVAKFEVFFQQPEEAYYDFSGIVTGNLEDEGIDPTGEIENGVSILGVAVLIIAFSVLM